MDYIAFAVNKTVEKITDDAIRRIKDGGRGEDGEVGIGAVLGFYIDSFPEDAQKVSPEELADMEMEPFTLVGTYGGFYVLNTGKEYAIAKRHQRTDFANKEDEKRLRKIAEGSDIILSGGGTKEEIETAKRLIEASAIERKPLSLQDMRDKLYYALLGDDAKKEMFIDITGEKPTKKFLKTLDIETLKKIDTQIGTRVLSAFFDEADYRAVETVAFSGGPTFDDLYSYIRSDENMDNEEKQELIELMERVDALLAKSAEIDIMNGGELDLERFGEKEEVFTQIKEINAKAKHAVSSAENRSFLEENKKIGFFRERSVVKFVCKEDADDKYTVPTLNKRAVLDNAEALSVETKKEDSVIVYAGKKTIQDAALAIQSYVAITKSSTERKEVGKRADRAAGKGGYAL